MLTKLYVVMLESVDGDRFCYSIFDSVEKAENDIRQNMEADKIEGILNSYHIVVRMLNG